MKLMPLTPGQVSMLTRPSSGSVGGSGGSSGLSGGSSTFNGGTTNGTTGGMANNAAAAFVFNSGAAAAADLFWRYQYHPHHSGAFNFPPSPTYLPPTPFPSPLDFKHHLPANLSEYITLVFSTIMFAEFLLE